jgi:transcriptional regulator with XRE-family HTH domain
VPADRSALGSFLRSRRDALTPAQAGITPFPGPRRVPGLRKEELAVLAGLSPDHYSRLEQGRQHHVTEEVLHALTRALQLDEVESAHLRDLAAPVRRRPGPGYQVPQRPEPGLLRVMAALDDVPTLLLGRRGEVLARNALLPAVLGNPLEPGTSLMRWLFLDPDARARIVNWPEFAAASVGTMRLELGRHPDDRRLRDLVDDLRAADPDIARWWDSLGVADRTSVTKVIDHPVAGRLTFGIEAVTTPHEPEQRLIVYTVEARSETAQALEFLRGWATQHHLPATSPSRRQ